MARHRDRDHAAGLGDAADLGISQVATMSVQRVARGVAHDERAAQDRERIGDARGVQVREVDHHAQPLELSQQLEAEGGEPAAVECPDGHRVPDLRRLEVHQTEHAQAALVRPARVLELAVDAVRAFQTGQRGEPALAGGAPDVASGAREAGAAKSPAAARSASEGAFMRIQLGV